MRQTQNPQRDTVAVSADAEVLCSRQPTGTGTAQVLAETILPHLHDLFAGLQIRYSLK